MKQTMQNLACLCMMAALCSQLVHSRSYRLSLRLALGLEIFRVVLSIVTRGVSMLNLNGV